jgi:anaerobic ribonucleoside-triphosphate reductase activating protein
MYPVENLGPGRRIAIWVQGCSMHCEGCISQDLWERRGGSKVDVAGFAAGILKLAKNLDGITITGGEPFDQYRQLVSFCTFIKQNTDLNILVFSGYTLETLYQKFQDKLFTKCIDLLVDGPYVQHLHENGFLRGSGNQKMYSFDPEQEEIKATGIKVPPSGVVWSAAFDERKNVFLSGIPGKNDPEALQKKMQHSGIKFEI